MMLERLVAAKIERDTILGELELAA